MKGLASYIDHTVLKSTASEEEILTCCDEAVEHGFAAVCVNPCYVSLAAQALLGSKVKVCTVVDFPLGAATAEMKAALAALSVRDGAQELDMVMNVAAMKSGRPDAVHDEIRAVVSAVPDEIVVKVILEVCYLTNREIRNACLLALEAGAAFVKTSTGLGPGGATKEAVRVMEAAVGGRLGIKAAGGIRDRRWAEALIDCGATRIGTSCGLAIIGEKA